MPIKVRFAPSPTGYFSIGNARTALFNWLFARHEGGIFALRIEDTDKERSKKEYETSILEGLKWLGLNWDGDIIKQSERIEIYKKHLLKLINEKKAYYCFCTQEELESERQAQLSQGLFPKYSGKCKNIPKEVAENRKEKEKYVIRFKMPSYKLTFSDLIRGKITFDLELIGDVIIAKNLESPLYNFAAVIDDHEMDITHVIRGEDHISNTPIQIAIYESFGWNTPHFAHLPLILGPDRKKLSKRFLDLSLEDFKNSGYLPEAIINFLSLLGWHPTVDKEIMSLDEIIKDFNLKKVQKSGAIFNKEKLDWMNGYYIKKSDTEYLFEKLKSFIPQKWLQDEEKIKKIIEIEKGRLKTLKEFEKLAALFLEVKEYEPKLLIWKSSTVSTTVDNLTFVSSVIKGIPNHDFWSIDNIQKYLLSASESRGRGEILWPLRVALSGEEYSPGPAEIIYVLGKEESLRRIEEAVKKLNSLRET
jgi:glutamyl-tRNA synthetase